MDRETKFKAWHKNGHWVPLFHVTPYGDVMDMRVGCKVEITDDVTLVQYTGRKDKSGREVYAGYLVSDGHHTWEVKWDADSAGYMLYLNGKLNCDLQAVEWKEVVGNIYEVIKGDDDGRD